MAAALLFAGGFAVGHATAGHGHFDGRRPPLARNAGRMPDRVAPERHLPPRDRQPGQAPRRSNGGTPGQGQDQTPTPRSPNATPRSLTPTTPPSGA